MANIIDKMVWMAECTLLFKACIRSWKPVRCGNGVGLADCLFCQKGLKQGDITSPLVFSLLLNELSLDIKSNGKHGVLFHPDNIELFIMLFADVVVLLSFYRYPTCLQHHLNVLASNRPLPWSYRELRKSNIVVFRNGGYLASRERWLYKGYVVKIVNAYIHNWVCGWVPVLRFLILLRTKQQKWK